MDAIQELLVRAEAIADGFMGTTLQKVADSGETYRFSESEIRSLREAYKTGWLSGYALGLEEALDELRA